MTGSATKCNEVSGPLYHALLLAEKFPNRGGVRGGEGQKFCRIGGWRIYVGTFWTILRYLWGVFSSSFFWFAFGRSPEAICGPNGPSWGPFWSKLGDFWLTFWRLLGPLIFDTPLQR